MHRSLRRFPLTLSLALLSLTAGCTLRAGLTFPHPNVELERSPRHLALKLDGAIRDQFEASFGSGPGPVNVESWRETLANGFRHGLAPFFAAAPGANGGMTLELIETQLSYVPAAVTSAGGVVAVHAQLRYRARLLDAHGQVLQRLAGTALSKEPVTQGNHLTRAAGSAVEGLYENIASAFFSDEKPKGAAEASIIDQG
jgi:hypothetical protein